MGREGSKGLEDLRSLGSRMRRVWGRKGMSGMKGRVEMLRKVVTFREIRSQYNGN